MLGIDEDCLVAVPDTTKLVAPSGAYAELMEGAPLRVYSNERRLLFEYDPLSGKTSVYIPSGDLEFVTQQGDIIFTSARGLSLRAQTVEVMSRASTRLAVSDMLGKVLSTLTLQSQRTTLTSPEIAMTARRGEVQIEDMNWSGRKVSARVEQARLVIGRLERLANSVIEKAKNVYTTVQGGVHLKAGRMRTLLDGTYHFRSKRAYLRAQEDFKVNADRIHLG